MDLTLVSSSWDYAEMAQEVSCLYSGSINEPWGSRTPGEGAALKSFLPSLQVMPPR